MLNESQVRRLEELFRFETPDELSPGQLLQVAELGPQLIADWRAMRSALEYYAERSTYLPDTNCAEPIAQTYPPDIERDMGAQARAALGREGQE